MWASGPDISLCMETQISFCFVEHLSGNFLGAPAKPPIIRAAVPSSQGTININSCYSPLTCGVNQMSSGALGIMHMGHFLKGCLDNSLFLLQLPNFFLGSLGHQEGADVVIWGDSKCLYSQKSLKKCLCTYPRGVLP